jgi:translocator assembly and maintenance protein 41
LAASAALIDLPPIHAWERILPTRPIMALRRLSVSLNSNSCRIPELRGHWQISMRPLSPQYVRLLSRTTESPSWRTLNCSTRRYLASQSTKETTPLGVEQSLSNDQIATLPSSPSITTLSNPSPRAAAPPDWEDNPNYDISRFSELPHSNFGVNQHIVINDEFKEALRQILWQFRAPIRYAFAYGSGVFPQSKV